MLKNKQKYFCDICPRGCHVDRTVDTGFCRQTNKLKIAKVMMHHFEEPCISGDENMRGSGAIFFSGCNLRCVYCQNYVISHKNKGKFVSVKKLANIFKKLEKNGASNINLVTPTHYTNQILSALKIYKPQIPIVWNTGGYESVQTIKKLAGIVDVYLVDMKYASNDLALKYSKAGDYVQNNRAVIEEMIRQRPQNIFEQGMLKKGVIIRHLILPTHTTDSLACLNYIASTFGKDVIVSLMSQYEPKYVDGQYSEINRKITPLEYKRVVNHALKLGMMNCYTQDLSSADSKYTPKF